MKKFTVLTLFPEMFEGFVTTSIIKKALERNLITIEIVDIRNYSVGKHHQVDDYQYGGGQGMVLMLEPLVKAIHDHQTSNSLVILLTPQGETYQQKLAVNLANDSADLILICGHYEGFDERILHYVDLELSLGDYVLTGGELASMVLIDSIARLANDVINPDSHQNDSFSNGLLDYPVYTKPVIFEGHEVPAVLLSGHHQNIAQWREFKAFEKTFHKRPDLLKQKKLSQLQQQWLAELEQKEN
ncbi:tRNA (guanosine(37)-N1)-methyltransferase TrmD [Spiroplasma chrysopicola]|uniref:tRNA (guanine-N(1)-)-methyltransferase n=1 Tax=Spiroplasma chrysopicola DF-1 TaxID=1276227 RepID=R4U2V9_9MOLU|nr:tRNA (guanosine(37)-N1)-methyltransferase TrmD [Spiroplasma chrysopicola]AGM24823.1 tRNA (guanine-N(1)-)-methyltransferase [Spiroplasma chrysopicola DF-1]